MKKLIGILIVIATLLVLASVIPSMAAITEHPNVDEISLRKENEEKIVDLSRGNGDELGQIKPYVEQGAAIIYFNGWYAPPKPLLDIGMQTDDGEITWGFGRNDGTGNEAVKWAGFDENGLWTLRASGGIPIQEGSHTFKVVAKFTDETTKVFHSAHYYNDDTVLDQWGNISGGACVGQWLNFAGAYSVAAFTANAPFEGVRIPVQWNSKKSDGRSITFDLSLFAFNGNVENSMNGTPLATVRVNPEGDQAGGNKIEFDALPAGQYVVAVIVVEGETDFYTVLPETGDPSRALYMNNLSGAQATKTFNFGVKTADPDTFFGPVPNESVTAEDDGVKLLITANMLAADGNLYTNGCQHELLTEEGSGMPFARFTSGDNFDPCAYIKPVPTTDAANKYAAVKYRTSSANVTASFYTLVAEPHVKDLVLTGDGEWHTMIVDLTLSPGDGTNTNWNGEFNRLDPVNSANVSVDYAWIAFFADRGAAEAYQGPDLTLAAPKIVVESISACGGETVSINVSIENNPGILGATFKLYYADGLTLTQIENGNAFDNLTIPANLRSGCTLTWDEIDIDPDDLVSEGTVVTLTFNVAQWLEKNAFLPIAIEYEHGDIIDLNLESIELGIINGGVTVLSFMPGDVNNDGRINSLDVIMIRRYIVDGCTTDSEGYNISLIEAAADVNDDGKINSLDVIMIRRYIADGCVTDPSGYNIVLLPSSHFSGSGAGNGGQQNDGPDDPQTDASGLSYTNNGDGTCLISGIGTFVGETLVIPDSINGLKVTSIGDNAFAGCTNITSVEIPDSVTHIDNYAFSNCANLTEITIPKSVTSIGFCSFSGCNSVETVNFGGSLEDWCQIEFTVSKEPTSSSCTCNPCRSGTSLYINGTQLTEVIIPNDMEIIGDAVFANCSNLISVTIPDSVTSIGEWAFANCTSLTEIDIPGSVTSIGEFAFSNCTGLTSVTIPDSVTSIGFAFPSCTSLTEVTIPIALLSNISLQGIFSSNDCYVERVTLTGEGETIPSRAFSQCTRLTDISIPDGVTSIGEFAFLKCASLTEITIPDSVTSIGDLVFYNCTNLRDFYYTGTIQQWNQVTKESDWNKGCNFTVHCTDGTI